MSTRWFERLTEVERIVIALQEGAPEAATPAQVLATANTHTLERAARVSSAALWNWIEDSARILIELAGPSLTDDKAVGALYGPLHDEAYEDVVAFVRIRQPFLLDDAARRHGELRIAEMPSRRWAAMTHTTGFVAIGQTYGVLGAWVARNATPHPSAPICELYPTILAETGATDVPIEIRWPINELSALTDSPLPHSWSDVVSACGGAGSHSSGVPPEFR